jgi:hypothetical protein
MIPLPNPTRTAARTPRPKEKGIGQPLPNRLAVNTEIKEAQAPTDRSIPFASMTRDMPRVNRARGLPARRIFVIFWRLKNSGTAAAKSAKTTTKRITPLGICSIAANLRARMGELTMCRNFFKLFGGLSGVPRKVVDFGFQTEHFLNHIL